MDNFLRDRGIDDDHRQQIVDELFTKLDMDANGRIEISEFTEQYLITKNALVEKEDFFKNNILENHRKLKDARANFERARQAHGNFISGPIGILTV